MIIKWIIEQIIYFFYSINYNRFLPLNQKHRDDIKKKKGTKKNFLKIAYSWSIKNSLLIYLDQHFSLIKKFDYQRNNRDSK